MTTMIFEKILQKSIFVKLNYFLICQEKFLPSSYKVIARRISSSLFAL